MDPCRSVMALDLTQRLSLHHGSSDLRTPRSNRIEPFDQDTSHQQTGPRRSPRVEKRSSLSTMQFGSEMPSAELFSVALSSSVPTTPRNLSSPVIYPRLVPSPPNEFLASLRSKTLLDYDFMRDFSLAKRKPLQNRNLSKMSASSVYSMRMAQIHLEQQAQRLQKLQLPVSTSLAGNKQDGEIRSATSTSYSGVSPSSARSKPPTYRRILKTKAYEADRTEEDQTETSTCFPTLWRPTDSPRTGEKAILRLKYRHPEPPSPVAEPPTDSEQSRARSYRRHTREAPATPTGSLVSEGLSDFDLRKCHPASSVTAIHGFLQEQDVAALLEETGYDRMELYALWGRFKALCAIAKSPKGIDKETFRRGIPQLSVEDQFFIDRVFDILDADGSGILEWSEFIEALSALEKGDVAKRVQFLFRVYDLNGDGATINRDEVMRFFLASLLIETTDELVDVAKHFVGKIFEAVGCGGRDIMKIEDALRYMSDHPSADIYSLFGRTMVSKQRMTSVATNVDSRPGSFKSRVTHITNTE